MSTRDIEAHLHEIYGVEVSATLISQVTEEVMEEVRAWQSRPLEALYMIVYLDALVVKMRHEGRVENRGVRGYRGNRWRAPKKCWGYGPARRKEPSYGCRS
jgi:transposase-like protein